MGITRISRHLLFTFLEGSLKRKRSLKAVTCSCHLSFVVPGTLRVSTCRPDLFFLSFSFVVGVHTFSTQVETTLQFFVLLGFSCDCLLTNLHNNISVFYLMGNFIYHIRRYTTPLLWIKCSFFFLFSFVFVPCLVSQFI